jgi:hypothetical protein
VHVDCLVEAAWHHRKIYRNPGQVMRIGWEKASLSARARGHAGNHRLHHRWVQSTASKKRPVVTNVAIAREPAGWCWSWAVVDDRPEPVLPLDFDRQTPIRCDGSVRSDPREQLSPTKHPEAEPMRRPILEQQHRSCWTVFLR